MKNFNNLIWFQNFEKDINMYREYRRIKQELIDYYILIF